MGVVKKKHTCAHYTGMCVWRCVCGDVCGAPHHRLAMAWTCVCTGRRERERGIWQKKDCMMDEGCKQRRPETHTPHQLTQPFVETGRQAGRQTETERESERPYKSDRSKSSIIV
mmetsp:Transcript_47222/g.117866  ORF Transcript_47222/g.117866 Transcript_47222/m.117866 type:complete len:114 (-) Transcript_47222:144-485(-)